MVVSASAGRGVHIVQPLIQLQLHNIISHPVLLQKSATSFVLGKVSVEKNSSSNTGRSLAPLL